jgi:hypothetical protein
MPVHSTRETLDSRPCEEKARHSTDIRAALFSPLTTSQQVLRWQDTD